MFKLEVYHDILGEPAVVEFLTDMSLTPVEDLINYDWAKLYRIRTDGNAFVYLEGRFIHGSLQWLVVDEVNLIQAPVKLEQYFSNNQRRKHGNHTGN